MSVRIMTAVWAHGPDVAADRLLLLAIADNANDDGEAWPSIKRLAVKCCVEERALRYGIRRLEEHGWIKIEERAGRPNLYRILPERLQQEREGGQLVAGLHSGAGGQLVAGDGGQPSAGAPATGCSQSITNPSLQPSLSSLEAEFDEFWALYPRKTGKGGPQGARAKFKAARKKVSHQELMDGLRRQLPRWTDPQFVPNPTTWLNQERWADEEPERRNFGRLSDEDERMVREWLRINMVQYPDELLEEQPEGEAGERWRAERRRLQEAHYARAVKAVVEEGWA